MEECICEDINKKVVTELLLSTNREGMDKLVLALESSGYFNAPASTRYHLSVKGGLVIHSLSVYHLFKDKIKTYDLNLSNESIIICALLHDLCKIGAYINNGNGYSWNIKQPKGHSRLSIERIEKYIKLSQEEKTLIQYHMGMYGTYEFLGVDKGEYTLKELINWYNINKLSKLFYFCDDMSSQFLEKQYKEGEIKC